MDRIVAITRTMRMIQTIGRCAIVVFIMTVSVVSMVACGLEDDNTKYDCTCTTNCDNSTQLYSFCEEEISTAQAKAQSNCNALASSLCTAFTGSPKVTCSTADSC